MKILYSDISGSGPYHEEEKLRMENQGDTYVITHRIIAPMAGSGEWSYSFNADISQGDFLSELYHALPYVASIFTKTDAAKLLKEIQSAP